MENEKNLLVVVVDTSLPLVGEGKLNTKDYLNAVTVFVNCHLMLKPSNKAAVIVCDTIDTRFVYSEDIVETDSTSRHQCTGQCEIFHLVSSTLMANVTNFLTIQLKKEITKTEPLIGAACSKALCYITRLERECEPGIKLNSRILIITGCENECDKYVRFMNIIFTAQRQNVIMDVCSLENDVALLQQAADITEGVFFKIPKIPKTMMPNTPALLEYLVWIFLPDPTMRKKFVLPTANTVDYRPFCFCHKELIDVGYVCSVCLSIFCKVTPICTTCEVVFKAPAALAGKPKKKKASKMV